MLVLTELQFILSSVGMILYSGPYGHTKSQTNP